MCRLMLLPPVDEEEVEGRRLGRARSSPVLARRKNPPSLSRRSSLEGSRSPGGGGGPSVPRLPGMSSLGAPLSAPSTERHLCTPPRQPLPPRPEQEEAAKGAGRRLSGSADADGQPHPVPRAGRSGSADADGQPLPAPRCPGLTSSIRVAVRVRPLAGPGIIEVVGQGTSILVHKAGATGGNEALSSQQGRTEERSFDRVFGPAATQAEVYAWCCQPLVATAVKESCSATIFVYGATGAGKTHTMFGEQNDSQEGLIYRTTREVFKAIENGAAASAEVKVSFLELYNEKLYDLLHDGSGGSGGLCNILEDERRGVVKIMNMREVAVSTVNDALSQLRDGLQLRKVESTAANQRSSRSHAIFVLKVGRTAAGDTRRSGARICLIDLAGSERASHTQNVGSALRDGAKINQSLLALANCINALGDRQLGETREGAKTQQRKPPYRDSKLTLLLKSSLVGGGLVSMIANVHPGQDHFEDSNNTLEYAKRASTVRAPVLIRREGPRDLPREALREARSSATSVPARGRPRGQSSPPPSPGEARSMLLDDVSFDLGTPCRNLRRREGGGGEWETADLPVANGAEATHACRAWRRETISAASTPSCPPAPRQQRASSMPRASTAGMRRPAATIASSITEPAPGEKAPPGFGLDAPSLHEPGPTQLEPTPFAPSPPPRAQARASLSYRARVTDIGGAQFVGPCGAEAEGSGKDPVMLRIVESLQAEKAAMGEQMRAIMADRDRLEAECARLRDANLEKDRQLAEVLSSKMPEVRCNHCGAPANG